MMAAARRATAAAALALTLAALAAAPSSAAYRVSTDNLRLRAPDLLRGDYKAAVGDFGLPPFGGTLLGQIFYSNETGCAPLAANVTRARGGLATMLLLDRGACFFAQKIFNAQRAGADAVLIADNRDEPLLTMAEPSSHPDADKLIDSITVPASLITLQLGKRIKAVLLGDIPEGEEAPAVVAELDWSETIPDDSPQVSYSLWGTSSNACGAVCDRLAAFLREFSGTAAALAGGGANNDTAFSPHYASWRCSGEAEDDACAPQCIFRGRYCAADPPGAARVRGRDVAAMNLRHACAHRASPQLWWPFAAAFAENCTMASGNYNHDCAEGIMERVGYSGKALNAVDLCIGNIDADAPNELMEAEQALQEDANNTGAGTIIMMPTIVINDVQYRGRLEPSAVLRAICAGFEEGTEPPLCLGSAVQVNQCELPGNGGCWAEGDLSACVDTFRGHKCVCPGGTTGNGYACDDIDECAIQPSVCDQLCKNYLGGYKCGCRAGFRLVGAATCLPLAPPGRGHHHPGAGAAAWAAFAAALLTALAAGVIYKWRMRVHMDREIREILGQYMPLGAADEAEACELVPERGGAASTWAKAMP